MQVEQLDARRPRGGVGDGTGGGKSSNGRDAEGGDGNSKDCGGKPSKEALAAKGTQAALDAIGPRTEIGKALDATGQRADAGWGVGALSSTGSQAQRAAMRD